MSGRTQKTVEQKKLEGTFRKDRNPEKLVIDEADEGVNEPPDWMGDEAKRAWFRYIPLLQQCHVWRQAHEPAMIGFCILHGTMFERGKAIKKGRELGICPLDPSEHAQYRQYIAELGMGPVSMTKLRSDPHLRAKSPRGRKKNTRFD